MDLVAQLTPPLLAHHTSSVGAVIVETLLGLLVTSVFVAVWARERHGRGGE